MLSSLVWLMTLAATGIGGGDGIDPNIASLGLSYTSKVFRLHVLDL